MIGDPLIADISIQPGGIAIITGKGYGATNVVVMDRGGAVLMERTVEVKGPPDRLVYVYRGVARNTYSCTPECAPRITLGDDSDYLRQDHRSGRQPQHPGARRRRRRIALRPNEPPARFRRAAT